MKESMNKQMMYVQRIHSVYPDLQIETVSFNNAGQNNDILIINEEFICRFPKYTAAVAELKIETAILSGIQDYITLNIPNPIYKSLETPRVGQAFVGYRLIPGEPLWHDTLMLIDDDKTLDVLATQLATFLKELHHIPVDEAIACDLPVCDSYDECVDIYARFRGKLFPYMRPDASNWTASHFETFLSNPGNFEYKLVLKHGDFGTSNILFDVKTQTINGIIDFGGSGLGDPAYDFGDFSTRSNMGVKIT